MSLFARLLAEKVLAGASWLIPARHSAWAEGMSRELEEIHSDRAALAFAVGCFRAAFHIAIIARFAPLWASIFSSLPSPSSLGSPPTMTDIFQRPRTLGLLGAAAAVGLGMFYMAVAGAPASYPLVNFAALVLGASLWLALGRAAAAPVAAAGLIGMALAAALLGTAFFGAAADGASRWVSVGPFNLQVSLIVVPVMLVLYARRTDFAGTFAMMAAALALALQPDRAMAGVLVIGLTALSLARRQWLTVVATGASVLAFAWTLFVPDSLSAVPYVDHILYTSFDVSLLAGLAVLFGSLALVAPALIAAARGLGDRSTLFAFAGCWAAIVAAAAIGNYPTPLVGYGGSAVLGYLLSAALLPNRRFEVASTSALVSDTQNAEQTDQLRSELSVAYPA